MSTYAHANCTIKLSKSLIKTIDKVTAYCKQHLTNYKIPKSITVLEELPKSTVGKILRRELRSA